MTDWTTMTDDDLTLHGDLAGGMYDDTADDTWTAQKAEIEAERDRRRAEEAAASRARKQRAHDAYVNTPEGRLDQARKDLAAAEKTLAASKGSASFDPTQPNSWGDRTLAEAQAARDEKVNAADEVERLRADVAEQERRLPYAGTTDEEVALAFEGAEVELEELRAEVKRLGRPDVSSSPAAARKAQRLLDEAQTAWSALANEQTARRDEHRLSSFVQDAVERSAHARRQTLLQQWTAHVAKLERKQDAALKQWGPDAAAAWLEEIRTATKNRDNLAAAISSRAPLAADELEAARAAHEEKFALGVLRVAGPRAVEASW